MAVLSLSVHSFLLCFLLAHPQPFVIFFFSYFPLLSHRKYIYKSGSLYLLWIVVSAGTSACHPFLEPWRCPTSMNRHIHKYVILHWYTARTTHPNLSFNLLWQILGFGIICVHCIFIYTSMYSTSIYEHLFICP